ncbi:MAG: DUF5522 domain-containing protein [Acidimicrobiales bacterium]
MDVPLPHPSRLSPSDPNYAAIIATHEAAVRAGEQLYRDPATDLFVLTVLAHLERDSCCTQGCRHCPYVEI